MWIQKTWERLKYRLLYNIAIAVNLKAQKFNICKEAEFVINFKPWYFRRAIYNVIALDEKKAILTHGECCFCVNSAVYGV